MRYLILISILTMSLSGCESFDAEELKLLAKDDPRFKSIVRLRVNAAKEIKGLKSDLEVYRDAYEERIRQEKDIHQKKIEEVRGRMNQLNSRTEQYRTAYEKEIGELQNLLQVKKTQAEELDRTLNNINDVLNKRGALSFTLEEVRMWEDRKRALEQRYVPLYSEIDSIESKIALRKKKLKYL